MIHYQFHEAQSKPASAPVATWHQGGPGGSSFIGLFTEMGFFQASRSHPTLPPKTHRLPASCTLGVFKAGQNNYVTYLQQ